MRVMYRHCPERGVQNRIEVNRLLLMHHLSFHCIESDLYCRTSALWASHAEIIFGCDLRPR